MRFDLRPYMETFEKRRKNHTSVRKVDAMIKTFSCPPFYTEKNITINKNIFALMFDKVRKNITSSQHVTQMVYLLFSIIIIITYHTNKKPLWK